MFGWFNWFKSVDVGIDMGTSSVLIYCKGRGIVLREPAVAAVDKSTNEVKGVGIEAQRMLGRTPGNIIAVRPLKNGVISDDMVTLKMLQMFILKWRGRRSIKNARVMVCVPSGVTDVEGKIDFHCRTREIYNLIRGVTAPFPGAFAMIKDKKIIIWDAVPFDEMLDFSQYAPGEIIDIYDNNLIIRTLDGSLLIRKYDYEGNITAGDVLV